MAMYRCGGGAMADDITPSNTSPVALTADTPVNPTANGYAIESYDSVTPSGTITHISSNKIIKFNNEGYIIAGYERVYPTTPSSVVPLLSGGIYQPNRNCYAILTYTEHTPSTSGASFTSGFVKMSSSGYAYSEQPTLKATTLWTNSSPTSSFSSQAVTLSQDVDNFAYIGIRYKASTSSSAETNEYLVSTADYKKSQSGNSHVRLVIAATNSNGNVYLRATYYISDTSLNIGDAYRMNNNAGASNTLCIPTSIVGYNISA